jgi:membrane dipeptidase
MRLIDLHTDWLLQYAAETTLFPPALYAAVPQRLRQAEGYLHGTSAAIVACYRNADDWLAQADPWAALGALITRIEAEFPGRLLLGSADVARWNAEPAGLCWAMIGVEGFDRLIRRSEDLDHVPRLFERGVRLFQPVYTPQNELAGSSRDGDDRGLTDLGRAFLQSLAGLGAKEVRPLFDLAHMNPRAASDALAWFEADPVRAEQVIPVYSHGALCHDGFSTPRAITLDNLRRLRALGGVVGFSVGPPFYTAADQLKADLESAASLPFQNAAGFDGIAIGTDFLGVDRTLANLGTVEEVVAWVRKTFDSKAAAAIIEGNARELIRRACCAEGRIDVHDT